MKMKIVLLLVLALVFVAIPVMARETYSPPYQGPKGGYGSPGTPDYYPKGYPLPFPFPPGHNIPPIPENFHPGFPGTAPIPRSVPENPHLLRPILPDPMPLFTPHPDPIVCAPELGCKDVGIPELGF